MVRTIAAFLVGVLLGGAGVGLYAKRQVSQAFSGGPEALRQRAIDHVDARLELRADQKEVLAAALTRAQREIQDLRFRNMPEIEQILTEAYDQVMEVLDPTQRDELDELIGDLLARLGPYIDPGA